MPSPIRFRAVYLKPLGIALLAFGLSACAQQSRPGYYDTPRESTLSDAQSQAQGRESPRAPSQIQLGFGRQEGQTKPEAAQAPQAAQSQASVRPLAEPKTFLGTVPCPSPGSACSAARITLTLAPGGEWRARTVLLDAPSQKPMAQQGCWDVTGTNPLRIVLMLKNNEASKASLSFVNDNVLRVLTLDDAQPLVEHRLTRQPDLDAIDELPSAPLSCSVSSPAPAN